MNTTELIERVAAENDIAKEHARKIVDSTFAAIIAAAVAGDEVVSRRSMREKSSTVLSRRLSRRPSPETKSRCQASAVSR